MLMVSEQEQIATPRLVVGKHLVADFAFAGLLGGHIV